MPQLEIGMSPEINELAEALAGAQAEITGAKKDKTAQIRSDKGQYSYSYSDLEGVWEACRGPLSKHGLCVLQPVATEGQHVTVATILAHKSGQWISSALTLFASQGTPQAIGSAITYGRRYGLSSMVGIAPAEDDDGAAASHEQPQAGARKAPERRPAPVQQASTPPKPADTKPFVTAGMEMINPAVPIAVTADWAYMGTKISKVIEVMHRYKAQIESMTNSDYDYYDALAKEDFKHANDVTTKGIAAARRVVLELYNRTTKIERGLAPPSWSLGVTEDDLPPKQSELIPQAQEVPYGD